MLKKDYIKTMNVCECEGGGGRVEGLLGRLR